MIWIESIILETKVKVYLIHTHTHKKHEQTDLR